MPRRKCVLFIASALLCAFPSITSAQVLTRTLAVGSSGTDVSSLQEFLKTKNYFAYAITGYFGPITKQAVSAFQRASGIDPIGLVGPQTRALLNGLVGGGVSTPAAPGSLTITRQLSIGMTGNDVLALQQFLVQKGFLTAEPTGYFGPLTLAAVSAFQSANGLPAVGEVGPQTRALLVSLASAPAVSDNEDLDESPDESVSEDDEDEDNETERRHSQRGNSSSEGETQEPPAEDPEDTTAPVISSVASSTTTTTATITWTTNEAASSTVNYGATSSYGTASTSAALVTSHSVTLTGLTDGTTYHFNVGGADASGNVSTSSDATFITDAEVSPGQMSFAVGGQSLGDYFFKRGTPLVAYEFAEQLRTNFDLTGTDNFTVYNTATLVHDGSFAAATDWTLTLLNVASGGSSVLDVSNSNNVDDDNYWWNTVNNSATTGNPADTADSPGPVLRAAIDTLNDYPGLAAFTWSQGQSDAAYLDDALGNDLAYKAALEDVFVEIRDAVGSSTLPIFIHRIGSHNTTGTVGVQMLREVQNDIIDEDPYTYFGAEEYDQRLALASAYNGAVLTSGSAVINMTTPGTSGFGVNIGVVGENIPLGSYVTSLTATSITLNTPVTESATQTINREDSVHLYPGFSGDEPLDGPGGTQHNTDQGFYAVADRLAQRIAQVKGESGFTYGVGPYLSGFASAPDYNDTTIDVTVTHDGGSDFTMGGTLGWRVELDDVAQTISNLARVNATTIRITLSSPLADGGLEVWPAWGNMAHKNYNSFTYDNSPLELPLQATSITATIATPADTTAPVISAIASSTSSSAATVTWTTNEAASSTVNYGATSSYGTASTSAALVTSHSITLTGLTADTTYHFSVGGADASGNVSTSSDATFTTGSTGDEQALFTRLSNAGYTATSDEQAAISTFINGLKTDNIWTTIDGLYITAGLGATSGEAAIAGKVNWKQNAFPLTASGTVTWMPDQYAKSNAVDSLLDTGYNASSGGGNYVQNSATLWVLIRDNIQDASNLFGNGAAFVRPRNVSNAAAHRINDVTSGSKSSITDASGLWATVRSGVNTRALYRNEVDLVASVNTATSTAPTASNLRMFLAASSGAPAANQVSAFGLGGALTSTQLGNLRTRLNTLRSALGAN